MDNNQVTALVTRLMTIQTETLRADITRLTEELNRYRIADNVTEYTVQTTDENIVCNESLEVIRSLPEFSGKDYVSWREAVNNSMHLYTNGSKRYFAALTILRNKITHEANNVLTNHGTVPNLDAILARLDFAYADKRPLHVLEQEISILRQGNDATIDFYNKVNEKLTLIINKTIMTYGNNSEITKELNKNHRESALRIFIIGLNQPLSNIVLSLNPKDLPNALAKTQEIEANNQRVKFANQYYQNDHTTRRQIHSQNYQHRNNLRFNHERHNKTYKPIVESMEVDPTTSNFRQQTNFVSYRQPQQVQSYRAPQQAQHYAPRPQYQGNHNQNTYNNNQYTSKRQRPDSTVNIPNKQPRVNNLNEEAFLDKGTTFHSYSSEQEEVNCLKF